MSDVRCALFAVRGYLLVVCWLFVDVVFVVCWLVCVGSLCHVCRFWFVDVRW